MEQIEVPDQFVDNNEFQLEGIDFITSGDQYLTFTLGEENYGIEYPCRQRDQRVGCPDSYSECTSSC